LHVIIVVSNPCQFAKRYILAKEFIQRIEKEEQNVILYVVELIYPKQKYILTTRKNPRHLQLFAPTPLWHKENMVNLGVKHLLPASWKAVAWIDADVEFENTTWATDTLKILNGCKDVVQLFSHAVDMNAKGLTLNVFNSAGYQYTKQNPHIGKGCNYWHPGFAWACTRKAYEQMGGLLDVGVLGSGDNLMLFSILGIAEKTLNYNYSASYKSSIMEFQERARGLRFGYVPGVIRHHFHGSKVNRKYTERWQILIKHEFDPCIHATKDSNGVIVPTAECPPDFLNDVMNYFRERNEDEEFAK
jgi:hypothetical protein